MRSCACPNYGLHRTSSSRTSKAPPLSIGVDADDDQILKQLFARIVPVGINGPGLTDIKHAFDRIATAAYGERITVLCTRRSRLQIGTTRCSVLRGNLKAFRYLTDI